MTQKLINEIELKNIIKNMVMKSLNENYFNGGITAYEAKEKTDERESDMNSETGENKQRRGQVEGYFSNPGVDIAQYAYNLYNIEVKKGEDTNDMKNARSKFMKCLNHETNEAGYPYSFTTSEINRLYSIISNNSLNERINKAINESFKKVLKEEYDIDAEMALWNQRANEPFGKVIHKLDTLMKEMFCEPDEYGFSKSPISDYVTAYSLDGNKQYTAKAIYRIIENYDMLQEPPVKRLVKKMIMLAKEQ